MSSDGGSISTTSRGRPSGPGTEARATPGSAGRSSTAGGRMEMRRTCIASAQRSSRVLPNVLAAGAASSSATVTYDWTGPDFGPSTCRRRTKGPAW